MKNELQSKRQSLLLLGAFALLPVLSACDSLPKLQGGTATTQTDGSELAIAVYDALRAHPETSQFNLQISSAEDEIIIKGLVTNRNEVASIEDVAGRVPGVRFVFTGGVFYE